MKLFCDIVANISARNHLTEDLNDPFSKIILTMFFDMFITSSLVFTTRSKFDYFDTILQNDQLSDSVKRTFLLDFCDSQQIYWTLSKFFRKYRPQRKNVHRLTNYNILS